MRENDGSPNSLRDCPSRWQKPRKAPFSGLSAVFNGHGVLGGIRTHGLSLRRRTLYPSELRRHTGWLERKTKIPQASGLRNNGDPDEIRTRVAAVKGRSLRPLDHRAAW